MWRLAFCWFVVPSVALACAPGETLHFFCTFQNGTKEVTVCHDDRTALYRFGAKGRAPELTIEQDVARLAYTPWPGIGRTIWEEVTFETAGHSYTVFASIDREPPADGAHDIVVTVSGGIVVARGDDSLATLTCDPGSVAFPWGTALFDAKEAAGMCYDPATRNWSTCVTNN